MKLLYKQTQSQGLVTLPPNESVMTAAKLMADKAVGSVVIMDGGQLVGIFTERDLLNRIVSKGIDPKSVTLSDVMSKNVQTVNVNDSLEDCYEKMQETRARHLPIVSEGQVVGMVTMRNLLEWLWREIEEENAHLKRYIQQG